MSGQSVNSYRDLLVWKASIELAVHCYDATTSFPAAETHGMTSQIRRSSASVAANIAEGHGREGSLQFVQFLRISQGSLKELETHLTICERVGLLPSSIAKNLRAETDEIGRMLRALIRAIQNKK